MSATTEFVQGGINTIPLDRLMLSAINVRKTDRAADIAALAESIAVHGLKQNLVVVPAHFSTGDPAPAHMDGEPAKSGGKHVWADKFEVIAGGRRFQAMQLLVEQDRLAADHPVPCRLEAREEATDTSLIENIERVTMNPADELDAYRAIVARHSPTPDAPDAATIETVARRFGKTAKYVTGRLRLAALAPDILEALRVGQITLDSAKAYASVEDHALQLKVFAAQNKSTWKSHDPAAVRGALREVTLSVNDGLVKFVGVEAYVAAGGRIEAEMFMGSWGDQQRVVDVKLIEQLAKDKAAPMVAPQAKKDGFKEGLLAVGVGTSARWPKSPEGMERYDGYYESKAPTKAELKKCVAVYAVAHDGDGIQKLGHYRPIPQRAPAEERDWEAERRARARENAIERRAAQLAAYELGKFTGTPLEGKAFWPTHMAQPVGLDQSDEAFTLVAILIRVPTDRVEANKANAERQIDEEAAAKAAAAESEADDDDADVMAVDEPSASAESTEND